MTHLAMGDGAEFDRIRALLSHFGTQAAGIGDDAAVLSIPTGEQLIASVDVAVEAVHFRAEWLAPDEIAWRAMHAALSDLAAMGATPRGVLLSWTLPPDRLQWLDAIAAGSAAAARAAEVPIVGGNLSRGDTLTLGTTVMGSAVHPVSRAGAQVGDRCYVTGRLGGPQAALRAWLAGAQPSAAARERFAHPVARLREGRWLAGAGATAMIDISDGLLADAGHLAAASGVSLAITSALVPVHPDSVHADALRSGEEYELFITAPLIDCAQFERELGTTLTAVGEVRHAEGGPRVRFDTPGDVSRVDSPRGHDHFS
jgi:thiamine-monophosphate kinase